MLTFGNVPVPFAASWTGEAGAFVATCRWAGGRPAVCQPSNPSAGKPLFGKPHFTRQRQVIAEGLCDLCGKPLKGSTRVSLSHARPVASGAEGLTIMQVEPLLHRECAAISVRHCPSLKRDIQNGAVEIRRVTQARVQIALLTEAAVGEFCGYRQAGVAGHAKVELLRWVDVDLGWLTRGLTISTREAAAR